VWKTISTRLHLKDSIALIVILDSLGMLVRCVLDGGLYRLFVDLLVLLHFGRKMDMPSSIEEEYIEDER